MTCKKLSLLQKLRDDKWSVEGNLEGKLTYALAQPKEKLKESEANAKIGSKACQKR